MDALVLVDGGVATGTVLLLGWAGHRAATLREAGTPADLTGRIRTVRRLTSICLALVAARLVVVGWLPPDAPVTPDEPPAVAPRHLLALLPVLVAGVAVLLLSNPRLRRLGQASRALTEGTIMAPALRHASADPRIAGPVQIAALAAGWSSVAPLLGWVGSAGGDQAGAGTAAGVGVGAGVAGAFAGGAVVVGVLGSALVAMAGVIAWWRLARRHQALAEAVIVPMRSARAVVPIRYARVATPVRGTETVRVPVRAASAAVPVRSSRSAEVVG